MFTDPMENSFMKSCVPVYKPAKDSKIRSNLNCIGDIEGTVILIYRGLECRKCSNVFNKVDLKEFIYLCFRLFKLLMDFACTSAVPKLDAGMMSFFTREMKWKILL